MCWAGCHRLDAIAARLGLARSGDPLDAVADPVLHALLEGAWNEKRQAFTAAFGSDDLDASVLLLPDLGVVEAERPAFRQYRQCDGARTFAREARYALCGG